MRRKREEKHKPVTTIQPLYQLHRKLHIHLHIRLALKLYFGTRVFIRSIRRHDEERLEINCCLNGGQHWDPPYYPTHLPPATTHNPPREPTTISTTPARPYPPKRQPTKKPWQKIGKQGSLRSRPGRVGPTSPMESQRQMQPPPRPMPTVRRCGFATTHRRMPRSREVLR